MNFGKTAIGLIQLAGGIATAIFVPGGQMIGIGMAVSGATAVVVGLGHKAVKARRLSQSMHPAARWRK